MSIPVTMLSARIAVLYPSFSLLRNSNSAISPSAMKSAAVEKPCHGRASGSAPQKPLRLPE